ncbi:MAG: hypothetical protein P4M13_00110 [Alphaproteobacteria bacterium]|nr:hypothetical protein [Alphaproteobacteria bacterium]
MRLSFSRPRIILMIGDDGIVVVPWETSHAQPFFVSAEDHGAAQDVLDFVARNPQARVTLFADNLAQDYRSDELPRLSIFDRAKLIRRRLKQVFPSALLTAHLNFKHSRDRVLMIGLHESNPVFLWADKLRNRLPDIALLPVEGARLAARLMPEAANGWAMLVCRQKSGGFRQIVTYKKDLVFTRLTPLSPADASDDDAEMIARDIQASLDYLTRQGLRDPLDLSVLLLMPDNLHSAVAFENLSLKSVRSLSPAAAAKHLSLPFTPEDDACDADIVFAAHLLLAMRPCLTLMLPEARQILRENTVRKFGLRAACAALLLVVLSGMWQAGSLISTLYRAETEAATLAKTRNALAEMQASAAPTTEPLGRMRQALERKRIYAQETPTPWAGLNELTGGALQDSQIVKLDWKKDGDAAPEVLTVTLRMTGSGNADDRAETVAAFTHAAQNIARAMPDYKVTDTKPPYPALPQEAVQTAEKTVATEPVGEISLQRKTP